MASPQTLTKSTDYIRALQNMGYSFRLNLLDDCVEINNQPMTDILEKVIATKLRDDGFKNIPAAMDAISAHAYANSFHPIRDYLNSLKYDGGKYVENLCSYFTNPDGLFPVWFKRWLIGAVRRAIQPGTQNRVFVLDGPQGIGKSEFVSWLCPSKLRKHYFKTGAVRPDDKDHRIALATTWVWEVGELRSTTRQADRDALKDFFTLEQIKDRLPYGRHTTTKPTLTSFLGTINSEREGVLSDPTGSRRWMFAKIEAIDWAYSTCVNIDDIWAEAQMLFLAGEPADLLPDEAKKAEEQNNTYKTENTLEALFLRYFEIDQANPTRFTPSIEILQELEAPKNPSLPLLGPRGFNPHSNVTARQLASLMTEMGVKRIKKASVPGYSSAVWGYLGVKHV